MLAIRAATPSLTRGDFRIVPSGSAAALAFTRSSDDGTVLVVANFSDQPARVEPPDAQGRWVETAGSPGVEIPYGWVWLLDR